MQNLVIVESPTKARTLSKYLGSKYQVEASMGHVRDLPKSDLGIDVENNFEPKYIIPRDKQKRVNEFRKLASEAKTIWLASDPDREGEAIAWHISELLRNPKAKSSKSKVKSKSSVVPAQMHRVEFHEITPEAIKEAFENPRHIDLKLVDAQQARRVLDRLVGYKLSPLLWRKVKSGLSAGRVQSVAVRLVVEREREIEAFKPVEYWSIEVELEKFDGPTRGLDGVPLTTTLIEKDGKKLVISNSEDAKIHQQALEEAQYEISRVVKKEVRKSPAPPFTTSTLQQTAANRLGMSAKKTMMLAQTLYEHGLITYMRTDSVNLSTQAIEAARDYISQTFGKNYLPASARIFKTKSKSAQEAHEAIRPTNVSLTSEKFKTMDGMTRDHIRLYELIWKRLVASQISEAVFDQTTVDVAARGSWEKGESLDYLLRATGSILKFDGWLRVYGRNTEEEEEEDGEKILPNLSEGEALKLLQIIPTQHFTEPPPRFNEASLIKKLEELGIGRPSTYAPTLSTVQDRYYIEKKEKKFFSTVLGIAVTDFLMQYFPNIVDYGFTAEMENELDEVAEGAREWRPMIAQFYKPFEEKLVSVDESVAKVKMEAEVTNRICPECGKPLVVKFGKFGKFLACSGFPDCKHTEGLEEKVDATCPDCGGQIVMRKTRKGRPFYGCKNWPSCKYASWTKPKKPGEPVKSADAETT